MRLIRWRRVGGGLGGVRVIGDSALPLPSLSFGSMTKKRTGERAADRLKSGLRLRSCFLGRFVPAAATHKHFWEWRNIERK
ncbi:hypothetical protein SKAU_G00142900 [Synaphobranchus kaupii]|uniref:Uncharacterized protein n=1 Tax=Synaphobranchus kaupii TaxID=118154 RepID=A0A9Q1FT22_SYNKA|nr:hypothetical protein SKAU_G00142900 [Synaphobranchus kaupii]